MALFIQIGIFTYLPRFCSCNGHLEGNYRFTQVRYLINVPLKETLTLTQTKTGRNGMYLNLNSYQGCVKTYIVSKSPLHCMNTNDESSIYKQNTKCH